MRRTGVAIAAVLCLLLIPSGGAVRGAVPGRNGRIAISRAGDIYTIRADGSGLRQLTGFGPDDSFDDWPAWAPGGRRIAFVRCAAGAVCDIVVLDLATGIETPITFDGADKPALDWAPDGDRIAYSSKVDGDWEIYIFNLDTRRTRRVTNNDTADLDVTWSPGGTWIAYAHSRERYGLFTRLWIVLKRLRDGKQKRLTPLRRGFGYYDPDWGPRGNALAIAGAHRSASWIYKIRRDGTGLTRLTRNPDTYDEHPTWSPNGRWIAFSNFYTATEDFDYNLRRIRSNGSDARPILVDKDHDDADPDWGVRPD